MVVLAVNVAVQTLSLFALFDKQNGHRGVFWSLTWHTQCQFRVVTQCFGRTTQIMFEVFDAPLVCVVTVLF